MNKRGCGRPVLAVEPAHLPGRSARKHRQRLAVGESASQRCLKEAIRIDAGPSPQRLIQLETFAVLAAETDRVNVADAQGRKIVQNRAGAAWLRADIDDVVHRQAGFDGDFLFVRIDFKVTVEAEIADNRDAEMGVSIGDVLESGQVHEQPPFAFAHALGP